MVLVVAPDIMTRGVPVMAAQVPGPVEGYVALVVPVSSNAPVPKASVRVVVVPNARLLHLQVKLLGLMIPVVVHVIVLDVEKSPDIVTTAPVDTVTAEAMTAPPVVQTAVVPLKVKTPLRVQTTSAADVRRIPLVPIGSAAVPANVTVALVAEGFAMVRPNTPVVTVLVTT